MSRAIDPKTYLPDEFHANGREIYAFFTNGIANSKLALVLGSAKIGVTATAQNWTTVTKASGARPPRPGGKATTTHDRK
ncbi:MAG: hypothetical protein M3463_07430, partial [Verrucomicrobiota bacterium]|nr:hypothetical protein [Verrucomicrobiota bacterium]